MFVNVFKPSNATEDSKLPVWVWITGGGYANSYWVNFDGTNIVQESGDNIVFVEFSYRVGALGFLASEQVRHNGDLNVGLLDQRRLLHWVQKYIHKVSLSEFSRDRPANARSRATNKCMSAVWW